MAELDKLDTKISDTVVGEVAEEAEARAASHRKTREGAEILIRDAQFCVVNDGPRQLMAEERSARHISSIRRRKRLVGYFKNAGREWRKQGDPEEVRVHDFLIKELVGAVPYGFMIRPPNAGLVNVGVDNDTAAFAVQTIRWWWQEVGRVVSARQPTGHHPPMAAYQRLARAIVEIELEGLADELG